MDQLQTLLCDIFENSALEKAVFSKSRANTVKRAQARIIQIKGASFLQIETFYTDGKARHQNLPLSKAPEAMLEQLENYKQLNVYTTAGECEVKCSSSGALHLINQHSADHEGNAQTHGIAQQHHHAFQSALLLRGQHQGAA
jgi:hypothetical protein